MIFASIGSMLPFDRFVRAVDEWAGENPQCSVFIQIGRGAYTPQNADWARTLPFHDYRRRLAESRIFVAHAGMGSILQALELCKPAVIMPRSAKLKEHVNDHQYDTCLRFREMNSLSVAYNERALQEQMTRAFSNLSFCFEPIAPTADEAFLTRIRTFFHDS